MPEIGARQDMGKNAILIAGPTASGKSVLALEMATRVDGVIINTDSMQVYEVLNQLSARPQPDGLARAKHALYGFVDPSVRFSTGAWLEAVKDLLGCNEMVGRTPIFVGGTGLYFKALQNGITGVPEVPEEIVARLGAEVASLGREERRALLQSRDPEMAALLVEVDRQRLVRALGVLESTGRSLAEWQSDTQEGLLDGYDVQKIVLNPPRDLLRQRIADRFLAMLDAGAVQEAEQLAALHLDPALPAMKAIGVREILRWRAGEISRDKAAELAIIATRQYAKRQRTWFRKQMCDWDWRTS